MSNQIIIDIHYKLLISGHHSYSFFVIHNHDGNDGSPQYQWV